DATAAHRSMPADCLVWYAGSGKPSPWGRRLMETETTIAKCECRRFEVPVTGIARPRQELQIEKRHSIHRLASAQWFPKFVTRLLSRITNFGNRALASLTYAAERAGRCVPPAFQQPHAFARWAIARRHRR